MGKMRFLSVIIDQQVAEHSEDSRTLCICLTPLLAFEHLACLLKRKIIFQRGLSLNSLTHIISHLQQGM